MSPLSHLPWPSCDGVSCPAASPARMDLKVVAVSFLLLVLCSGERCQSLTVPPNPLQLQAQPRELQAAAADFGGALPSPPSSWDRALAPPALAALL